MPDFVGGDPESNANECPAVWVNPETGDFLFRGKTITDPAVLDGQLARVRAEGYAETREEMSLGACSLAVPVRDREGEVVAALGLTASSVHRNATQLVAALTVAASGIRRGMSHRMVTPWRDHPSAQ